MKMAKRSALGFILLSSLFFNAVFAYDNKSTHIVISEAAVQRSTLKSDSSSLKKLGFWPFAAAQVFPNSIGKKQDITSLVQTGADFEDNNIRVINHFFDPINDTGLFYTSPSWATEDQGSIVFQNYSYRDAQSYLYRALTESTSSERERNFGLTFQTMGHVIHHLQDMAQPQHARMDVHLNIKNKWGHPLAGRCQVRERFSR